jgi:membrane-bound metal-dependent hydrolase YbcI (DUF457 family)
MTTPTHTLVGLIIGKLTGDYSTALIGSLAMDLDHAVSHYRHGLFSKPRKWLQTMLNQKDSWGDQRSFLHSIFSWVIISLILLAINFHIGLVFSIAYFFHLILDLLDQSDFWPFFPFKKLVVKGPVGYFSKQEIIFDIMLIVVFFLV